MANNKIDPMFWKKLPWKKESILHVYTCTRGSNESEIVRLENKMLWFGSESSRDKTVKTNYLYVFTIMQLKFNFDWIFRMQNPLIYVIINKKVYTCRSRPKWTSSLFCIHRNAAYSWHDISENLAEHPWHVCYSLVKCF